MAGVEWSLKEASSDEGVVPDDRSPDASDGAKDEAIDEAIEDATESLSESEPALDDARERRPLEREMANSLAKLARRLF